MIPENVLQSYSCRNCRGWHNGATCIRLVRDNVCAKQQMERLTSAMVVALQQLPLTSHRDRGIAPIDTFVVD